MQEIVKMDAGLKKDMTNLTEVGLSINITDNDSYLHAIRLLISHKEMQKKIIGYFEATKKNTYNAWKGICKLESDELAKLNPSGKHLKTEIGRWIDQQGRIRREEEARFREEVRRLAEERQLAEALQAEAEGDDAAAKEILEEKVFIIPPVVPSLTPKAQGVSSRVVWKFRIINESAIPRQYLMVNESAIRQVVFALKDKTSIAGVEVYSVREIAARGGGE